MIDFTTLQGLTIPEGVVTQITDESGRVIWAVANNAPIVLEVEKIVLNTYAGETLYENEEFILLDIYPKTNGTVNVTYGGLTKTITDTSGAEEPNAQQVFFGTFNGVTDSVSTASSGELVIEGEHRGVGIGTYASSSKNSSSRCSCVTAIIDLGNTNYLPSAAFSQCAKLTNVTIPKNVSYIGDNAFSGCNNLQNAIIQCRSFGRATMFGGIFTNCASLAEVKFGKLVTTVYARSFYGCTNLTNFIIDTENNSLSSEGGSLFNYDKTQFICYPSVIGSYTIPEGVAQINNSAFNGCTGLTSIVIPTSVTYIDAGAFLNCTELTSITVLATTPPTLYAASAMGDENVTCPIIVPKGCGEAYKAATYWSALADRIVEAS
jgi:hypothetical protein